MTDSDTSLLSGDDAQLPLFTSGEMDDAEFLLQKATAPTTHEFTGERLWQRDKVKYTAIVGLLSEGLGILKIARLLCCSGHTVQAVRDREGEAVAIGKERVRKNALAGAEVVTEALLDRILDPTSCEKISARDLAVIAGILVDKSQLLGGGPTARIETTTPALGHDDFNEHVKTLDAEYSMEGDEDTPEDTGLAPQTPEQKQISDGSNPDELAADIREDDDESISDT